MSDWQQFVDEVPWFLQPGQSVVVGEAGTWTRAPINGLPELSSLLELTTITPVRIEDTAYELLAWGPQDYRRGWLCHPPCSSDGGAVAPVHRSFWNVCGGIVERFREPDSWWLNQNDVLTLDATRVRIADALTDYAWLWREERMGISVRVGEYYVAAVEANGNLTVAHRDDGRLILFAPDHAYANVTPLPGSPPYSLLTIDDIPDLATWIEVAAAAWRRG